jgi:hypothetical protein
MHGGRPAAPQHRNALQKLMGGELCNQAAMAAAALAVLLRIGQSQTMQLLCLLLSMGMVLHGSRPAVPQLRNALQKLMGGEQSGEDSCSFLAVVRSHGVAWQQASCATAQECATEADGW